MKGQDRNSGGTGGPKPMANQPKIVAQMPEDPEIQKNLQQQKENDGYPGSCGI